MVTVEAALAAPALVVVAVVAAALPMAVGAKVACSDAAREAALLAARGADGARIAAVVDRLAPGDPTVTVAARGGLVHAEVTTQVALVRGLVPLTLRGQAVAAVEP